MRVLEQAATWTCTVSPILIGVYMGWGWGLAALGAGWLLYILAHAIVGVVMGIRDARRDAQRKE